MSNFIFLFCQWKGKQQNFIFCPLVIFLEGKKKIKKLFPKTWANTSNLYIFTFLLALLISEPKTFTTQTAFTTCTTIQVHPTQTH